MSEDTVETALQTNLLQMLRERRELAEQLAMELLCDIIGSEPELEDARISYVTVQIDRSLWLRAKHLPSQEAILEQWRLEHP
jgi:hypothetical protein